MSERLEDDKAYIRLFNQNTKLSKRVKELERQVSRYKARLETIADYINTENEFDCYREEGKE